MNPATPFSGLSLIIHLVVIGIAKAIGLVHKKKPGTVRQAPTSMRRGFDFAFSIGIILVVSSVMLFSFAIALTTSVREAQNDWHVKLVKNEWQELKDVDFGMLEYVAAQSDWKSLSITK
jgi:hypothetical protein